MTSHGTYTKHNDKKTAKLWTSRNPMQIIIDDDRIVNILKKHAKVYYKFTAMGILFPASVKNDTE